MDPALPFTHSKTSTPLSYNYYIDSSNNLSFRRNQYPILYHVRNDSRSLSSINWLLAVSAQCPVFLLALYRDFDSLETRRVVTTGLKVSHCQQPVATITSEPALTTRTTMLNEKPRRSSSCTTNSLRHLSQKYFSYRTLYIKCFRLSWASNKIFLIFDNCFYSKRKLQEFHQFPSSVISIAVKRGEII